MDETFHDGLPVERLRALGERRNGPGLLRLLTHTLFLVGSAALLVLADTPWQLGLGVGLHGIAQVGFFGALHECAHRTAFRTDALNQLGAWFASFWQLMAPPLFKQFHFAHHRHTHDIERDPELGGLAAFARWPSGLLALVNVTGLVILAGRVLMLLVSALLPLDAVWSRLFPYVKPAQRGGVAWGSRLLLLAHVLFVALAALLAPRLLRVYAAVPIAHALLTIYVTCEHRGLPTEGSILERTRSFDPGPLVRYLFWNMPHHAEHHAYPAVPFHALPALSAALDSQVVNRTGGLLGLYLRGGR